MKFLIQNVNTLPSGMVSGMTNVLTATGHKVTVWEKEDKPAFDVFDELEPDVFLCGNNVLDRAVSKCLSERQGRVLVTPLVKVLPAADTFVFGNGRCRRELTTQVACVGDVNQETFDSLITPLLNLNIKIVGNKRWEAPQYLGPIRPDTLRDLYASASVTLVFPPHQHPYNVWAAGGVPVVYRPNISEFDDTKLCQANTVSGYLDMVRQILRHDMARTRKRYSDIGRELVYQNGTYWHRVATLFRDCLAMTNEAERIINTYNATI